MTAIQAPLASKTLTGLTDIVAIEVVVSTRQLLIAEATGAIHLVEAQTWMDGIHPAAVIGTGYSGVTGIDVEESTRTVIVSDVDGLWSGTLTDANQSTATAFETSPSKPRRISVMGLLEGGLGVLVLDGNAKQHLDTYSLAAPAGSDRRTRISGITGATDAVAAWGNRFAYFLSSDAAGPTLHIADFVPKTTRVVAHPPFSGALCWLDHPSGWFLMVAADGRMAAVSQDGYINELPAPEGLDEPIVAVTVLGSTAFLATATSIWDVLLPSGFGLPIQLEAEDDALFIGGYAPLRITLQAGIAFEDLVFSTDDSDVLSVSPSKDNTFDEAAPHVLVLGGWREGTATVSAHHAVSGELVGKTTAKVSDTWATPDVGPARCVTGSCLAPTVYPAWGGGPGGPQNLPVTPAPANWRVAIVLIETTDGTYTTTTDAAARKAFADAFSNGVSVGGVNRSVIQYYREVSYGKTTFSFAGGAVVGPVKLPGDWASQYLLETDPDPADPAKTIPKRYGVKDDTWAAAVSAVEKANKKLTDDGKPALVDFPNVDAVVFVARAKSQPAAMPPNPPTATSIGEWVWPYQSTRTVKLNGKDRNLPIVFMPDEWTAIKSRPVYTTLTHELGHSLGLPDLYLYPSMNQDNKSREVNRWDLMSSSDSFAELSLPSRMLLGWVEPGQVRSLDFAAMGGGAFVDTFTLNAMEKQGVAGNALRGVEIRIANGRNYYFEYRNQQSAAAQGSANLPLGGRRVMGTDVVSPKGGQNYDSRPYALRLFDDPDGVDDTDGVLTEGAFLTTGTDYVEPDFSDGAPKDLVAEVRAVRNDSADLRIRYNSSATPELSIRPWPNGDKRWQSPDIEVVNDKTSDPKWKNTPWIGNPNTIIARVTNRGALEAKDVVAYISILNFTTDGKKSTLEPLGMTDPVTIPANTTVELKRKWIPDQAGHFCIQVDIPLYEKPGDASIHESSDRDNWAQSNYDTFWSETKSPATRQRFEVELVNSTPIRRPVYAVVNQTHPLHRTYVEHEWLTLAPGESARVGVMVESLDGDPAHAATVEELRSYLWEVPNQVDLSANVQDDCAPQCLGGASVQVLAGQATEVHDVGRDFDIFGHVSVINPRGPVGHGRVLVAIRNREDDPDSQWTVTGEVHDGFFRVEVGEPEPGSIVRAHYLGSYSYGPSDSEPIQI